MAMRHLAKAIGRIGGNKVSMDWDEFTVGGIVRIDRWENHILIFS